MPLWCLRTESGNGLADQEDVFLLAEQSLLEWGTSPSEKQLEQTKINVFGTFSENKIAPRMNILKYSCEPTFWFRSKITLNV